MAGAIYSVAELNMIITMFGCLCATIQASTGFYASVIHKKTFLLRSNPVLNRAHRTFGNFSTVFFLLGLFAGSSGFLGALIGLDGSPPLEFNDISFNIHFWGSFPIAIVILTKLVLSYFWKKKVFKYGKILGTATFIAWAYTWITSAISYYLRTIPSNPQHEPPLLLFPIELLWLQLIWPFLLGGLISIPILLRGSKIEKLKEKKSKV